MSRSWNASTPRRRARTRRPARGRDHGLAPDPPRPPGARRGLRRAGPRGRTEDSARRTPLGRRAALLRAYPDRTDLRRRRGRAEARSSAPSSPSRPSRTRTKRSPRQLHALRPLGDHLHRVAWAGRIASGGGVRAGVVWVNTFLVRDLTAPFGGVGISGIGREGGDYALDFYSDLKTLQILEGSVG